MKMTQQEQMIAALKTLGRHEIKRTHKYIVFNHPTREDCHVYLGKSGSCRVGKTVADSIPSAKLKMFLLEVSRICDWRDCSYLVGKWRVH